MLKTASDFEKSVAYITKDLNKDMVSNMKTQNKTMNSENFDLTMNQISMELDALYEKTRVLNDIVLYAQEYIKTNVYNKKQECEAILKSVEYNRDKMRSRSYIFFDVGILPGAGSYIDRDNSEIAKADINNNNIVLSGDTISKIAFKKFSLNTPSTNNETHTNNIDELINGTPYRSFYYLDKPAEDGIKESITCEFNNKTIINSFDVAASNCNIDSIHYINDDIVEIENNASSNIKKQREVTDIIINISSNNYKLVNTSDSETNPVLKYEYVFGLDSVQASVKNINQTCCHISQPIDLGAIDENTFIQLSAEYAAPGNSSVEFYIVDGGKDYPIIPIEDTMVSNEKVFYGLDTRFAVNKSKGYTIKKDNSVINSITIDQLPELNDSSYTIDYTPVDSFNHVVSDNVIKIKTIIRLYDLQGEVPYVSKLEIRKYGGEGLWKSTI